MVKKSAFRKKDKSVAAVVGALLLASMGITLFASFTLWYVPYTTTNNEQTAFTAQSSSFISLSHQLYGGLQPGQVITQSVKLGAPGAPPFTQSSQSQISYSNSKSYFSGYVNYAFNVTLVNTTATAGNGIPAGAVASVNIKLTNNQGSSEPVSYQQKLVINSNSYSKYEAGNLQNIVFYYQNGTVVPSWLESGNTNTSTNTTYWLKVSYGSYVAGIPPGGNETIVMAFFPKTDNVFNSVSTGEAPDLSPTYGQYDNGNHVFAAYFNGVAKPSDFIYSSSGISVQNVNSAGSTPHLSLLASNPRSHRGNTADFWVIFDKQIPDAPVQIVSSVIPSSSDHNSMTGMTCLCDMNQNNLAGAIAVGDWNTGGGNHGRGGNTNAYTLFTVNSNRFTSVDPGSQQIMTEDNLVFLNSTSGGVWNGSVDISNVLGHPNVFSSSNNVQSVLGASGRYVGVIANAVRSGTSWQLQVNWMRASIQPSNDVMPSVSFSQIKVSKTAPGGIVTGGYNVTYSGTFSFSGMITANSTFTSGQAGVLYLADGSSVSNLGGSVSVSSGVPISMSSVTGGNMSLAFIANSLSGKAVSVSDYGSSIVKLQSVRNTNLNFSIGNVLNLLGPGSIPYSASVQNINMTAFTYVINGSLSNAFRSAYNGQFGTGSAVSGGMITVTGTGNYVSVSLKAGSYISLSSINVQLAALLVNSI